MRRPALVVLPAMLSGFLFAAPRTVSHPASRSAPAAAGITMADLDRLGKMPGDLAALPAPGLPPGPAQLAKIRLGRQLFFDNRLSADHSMSCATCHDPNKGFADALPLGKGFGGKLLRRHSPTVLNAVYNVVQFWDGRAVGLEAQATGPIMSNAEMNMGTEQHVVETLQSDDSYVRQFKDLYGVSPNLKLVGDAIASFESTLVTPDSPFDRYVRGDKKALTMPQKRGLALFIGKAACTQCHSGSNFTDNRFHNVGVPQSGAAADLGRYEVTKNDADRRAFKTPTLRNVALTAPYLHDGSAATLRDVVDLYNRGGGTDSAKSDLLFELHLSEQEKSDLVAFLDALTGNMPSLMTPIQTANK